MERPIVDWNQFFEDVRYTLPYEQIVIGDASDPFSSTYQLDDPEQEVDDEFFAICEDVVTARKAKC